MNALLEFKQVTIPQGDCEGGLADVSFALHPGEVLFVLTDKARRHLPLMDAAQGLIEPESGDVLVHGTDWRALSPDAQAEGRACMGRIFSEQGPWLSNLDMDENITLRVRHRARRDDAEIYEEARALAVRLGMDELPGMRMPKYSNDVLQISQWVRALLDHPPLLLVEYGFVALHDAARSRIMEILKERMDAGAAMIWLTTKAEESARLGGNVRFVQYNDGALVEGRSEA